MIGFTVHKSGRFVTNPQELVRDLRTATESSLRRASFLVRRVLREKMSKAGGRDPFWGRTTVRDGILVRTGGTRARLSPGGRVYLSGLTMTTAVGSPDEHVRQLEEGGVVKPPPGQRFLRRPTAAAQTPAGVDRWAGQSIRNIAGARLWWNPHSANLWAVRRKGAFGPQTKRQAAKGDRDEFLYLLVRSIRTHARHMFRDTVAETEPRIVRDMMGGVSVAVAKANS